MTQEEITKALSHDNADDVYDEILSPDIHGINFSDTYLVPNLPTLEEAILAIPDVSLIGKSEQWIWVTITEQHKEFDTITEYLIYEANMFPFMDYGYSFKEILTRYNNNPINFKSL